MIKAEIDKDLKAAMLSGDKHLVNALRVVKSAILYKEVAENKRDEGLDEETVIAVLKKEQKTRKDAVELYEKAGESERAAQEKYELGIIAGYLPEELSEESVRSSIVAALKELSIDKPEQRDMGRVIGLVRKNAPTADGGLVAKILKEMIG